MRNLVKRFSVFLLLVLALSLTDVFVYASSTPTSNSTIGNTKTAFVSGIQVTWLGHSSFKIQSEEGTFVIDPYDKVPGYTMQNVEADAVFITTEKDDHNNKAAVKLTGKNVNFNVKTIDGETDILIFELSGKKIVHLGDISKMPEESILKEISKADLVMIPVGGTYTIDTKEALNILNLIKPKIIVPMHYREGNFDYRDISTVEEFLESSHPKKEWESNSFNMQDVHYFKKGTIIKLKQPK